MTLHFSTGNAKLNKNTLIAILSEVALQLTNEWSEGGESTKPDEKEENTDSNSKPKEEEPKETDNTDKPATQN